MQKRIIHNLLLRKWLILLCFMLLPTLTKADSNDRSSFYKQVTILSYKSKRRNGNSTFYKGAKLQLSNGINVELDALSSYTTYIPGNPMYGWGDIMFKKSIYY